MTGIAEALSAVEGLNVSAAVKAMGGKPEAYLRVVKLTARLTAETLGKLDKYVEEKNIHSYEIEIHGIKSVLNGIGAFELGSLAFELEKAAKAGELGFIEKNYPAFKELVTGMTGKISEAVRHVKEETPPAAGKGLDEALAKAEAAVKDFDNRLAMDLLAPFGGEAINGIMQALEAFDYDGAGELLSRMRQNGGIE